MKLFLEVRGKIANSPREVFCMAALEGFIENIDLWFDFIKKRNITSHVYSEIEMEDVLCSFDAFSLEISAFLKRIKG